MANLCGLTLVLLCAAVSVASGEYMTYREMYRNYSDDSGKNALSAVLHTIDSPLEGFNLLKENKLIQENIDKINENVWTKVLIHGSKAFCNANWTEKFRHAYFQGSNAGRLDKSRNYNVIIIKWTAACKRTPFLWSKRITQTGKRIADFLKTLSDKNRLHYNKTHLIGHSFGAQVSGAVGHYSNGQIARITGMDPALLLEREALLNKNDAKFVDIIHTSILGDKRVQGHINFYPEGGEFQNCNRFCSHGRAHKYMLETIKNPTVFPAKKCDCYVAYLMKDCENGDTAFMGEDVDESLSGNYYLHITRKVTQDSKFVIGNGTKSNEEIKKLYTDIKTKIDDPSSIEAVCQEFHRQHGPVVSSSGRTLVSLCKTANFLKELYPSTSRRSGSRWDHIKCTLENL